VIQCELTLLICETEILVPASFLPLASPLGGRDTCQVFLDLNAGRAGHGIYPLGYTIIMKHLRLSEISVAPYTI